MQGKMNSGVAKAIREEFPYAWQRYDEFMKNYNMKDIIKLGHVIIAGSFEIKLIGNLMTQEFYGRDGKRYASLEAIEKSLDLFTDTAINKWELGFHEDIGDRAIAIPKIGCGLGGLTWEEVCPIVEKISEKYSIDFVVYDNGDKS